jgi:hypothetical protein
LSQNLEHKGPESQKEFVSNYFENWKYLIYRRSYELLFINTYYNVEYDFQYTNTDIFEFIERGNTPPIRTTFSSGVACVTQ